MNAATLLPPALAAPATTYFTCLWSESEDAEFCAHETGDFGKIVAHLGEAHDLNLTDGKDFCGPCRIIYSDRLEGIEHLISHHLLCYEDFGVACETPPNANVTVWLQDFFQKVKELRKTIMSRILFSDDAGQPGGDDEADLDLDDILANIPPPE